VDVNRECGHRVIPAVHRFVSRRRLRPRRGQGMPRPPQVQRARMPVADGLLLVLLLCILAVLLPMRLGERRLRGVMYEYRLSV